MDISDPKRPSPAPQVRLLVVLSAGLRINFNESTSTKGNVVYRVDTGETG